MEIGYNPYKAKDDGYAGFSEGFDESDFDESDGVEYDGGDFDPFPEDLPVFD